MTWKRGGNPILVPHILVISLKNICLSSELLNKDRAVPPVKNAAQSRGGENKKDKYIMEAEGKGGIWN